ncbi:MAG: FtsX-like permease family protein, partial [Muribaculaceae bacterium]|nr:FtsX-like permease family protein [Muribaculaceae bacterium]
QYIIYALLLLLPAINLSSMMRGRLRHRVSEIGVRRAYGAKRRDIIRQLIGENLVVTVVGGLIGLGLSYLFMLTLSSEFFMFVDGNRISSLEAKMATPSFGMLFTWSTFFISVGACLVLNLLTATVPAWCASMMEPAVAISKSRT